MSVFEQLLNDVVQSRSTGAEASSSGVGGALMQLLGSDAPNAGLTNLIDRFKGAGLGQIVESWVSNSPNHSVSPNQLQTVLGSQQTAQLAAQSGLPIDRLLALLAQHLPAVVDRMTPGGNIPAADNQQADANQPG